MIKNKELEQGSRMKPGKMMGIILGVVVGVGVIGVLVVRGFMWGKLGGVDGGSSTGDGRRDGNMVSDVGGLDFEEGMMNMLDEKSGLEVVGGPVIDLSGTINGAGDMGMGGEMMGTTESAEMEGETAIAEPSGIAKITGTVLNNSENAYSMVSIRFRAMAEDGTRLSDCVGESWAGLGPRQMWDFVAECGAGEEPARVFVEEMGAR